MPGKTGSRRSRRRERNPQPLFRREAMTERLAFIERRRKRRSFSGPAEADFLLLGWLSVPNRPRRRSY